jgi:hypothetical protein
MSEMIDTYSKLRDDISGSKGAVIVSRRALDRKQAYADRTSSSPE